MLIHDDCLQGLREVADGYCTAVITDPPYGLPGGFMGKSWDNFDGKEDVGFGYYLSGLIDGEGCFRSHRNPSSGVHSCAFSMKLRDDDAAILKEVQAWCGIGTLFKSPEHEGSKPQLGWVVQDKEGCARLVGLLRRFPLRAKKRLDFEAWSEAVGEWVARPRGNRWEGPSEQIEAARLKAIIENCRTYRNPPWSGNLFQDQMRMVWEECFRVLRPGGMLLAFGGTRTFHRLACSIEDAGFELRDCMMWLYGSGFPKSLAIDKAIDRARDDRAEVLEVTAWIASARDAVGLTNRDVDEAFGFAGMAGHWTSQLSQPIVPTLEQVPQLLRVLGDPVVPDRIRTLLFELNGRKGTPGADWHNREVVGTKVMPDTTKVRAGFTGAWCNEEHGARREVALTTAATDKSRPWQSYGTALKPAWEPILVAMRPTDGTFAQNALAHGVAGVNVDAARVGEERKWPPNVTLDDEASRALGGPARFFYQAKVSAAERGDSRHPTMKPVDLMRWLVRMVRMPVGTRVLDPFAGSGTTGVACALEGVDFLGFEREADYFSAARDRIAGYSGERKLP